LRRALRRTVRQVTGADSAAVVLHTGDRHRLDPQLVTSDVAAFTTALSRATHTADADERARALGDALEEYRGRMCEGADYPWADELREYFHHRAVDVAVYLADHALSADPEQALALLERAAAWEPTSEPVCQRLMHVHHRLGHPQAAQHAYHRLERNLAEIDATPTEATRALRTQSTPDTSSDLRKRGPRQRRGSLAHR
jgi:DNA-binding SARP family transcriptional activator